jgi:Flp pilus assembly protein TadD
VSTPKSLKSKFFDEFKQGNLSSAQNTARLLTIEYPQHAIGWKLLGGLLSYTAKYELALGPLEKAVDITPEDPETQNNLGVVLKNLKRLPEAMLCLTKAIQIRPDYAEAHNNIGNVYRELGQLKEAVVHYDEAIRLIPNYAQAYNNLGITLNILGEKNRAEATLKLAIYFKSDLTDAYDNLAHCLAGQDRLAEALSVANQGVAVASNEIDRRKRVEHLLDLCQKQNARDLFGQQLAIYSRELWPVSDSEFDRLYTEGLFKTGTMFSPSRRRNRFRFLIQKFQEVQDLDGDIAECGCFKGLSSFLLCSTMKKNDESFSGTGYQIFDSFEGLSTPATVDQNKDYGNDRAPPKAIISSGHFAASVESVKHALDQFPNIEYFKGWIPEAFPANSDKKYKFVHVDVDLYQPTFDSFSYFWPLINKGGIMLCDDFNWSGARQAVEDFSKYNNIRFDVSEFHQAYFEKS